MKPRSHAPQVGLFVETLEANEVVSTGQGGEEEEVVQRFAVGHGSRVERVSDVVHIGEDVYVLARQVGFVGVAFDRVEPLEPVATRFMRVVVD